jgi:hypothetical protein
MIQKKNDVVKIKLFISTTSYYYATTIENFQKMLDSLGEIGAKFKVEMIDVNKKPEMAEKHNILVEPTLIVGNKYFIGRFEDDRVTKYIKQCFGKGLG